MKSTVHELNCNEKRVLSDMLTHFGNRSLLQFQAQGLPKYVTTKAFAEEEEPFKKSVTEIHASKVPADSNVISSHTIYKIKVGYNGERKLKARIAPHGKEDSLKLHLHYDCSQCAPTGVRLIFSMATIFKWLRSKDDLKSDFLQTGRDERDVYVHPLSESEQRKCTYGCSMPPLMDSSIPMPN